MKQLKKAALFLLAVICLGSFALLPVGAEGVWHSYTYNNNGEDVFSPDIYEVEQVVYGAQMGLEELERLDNPQDMCFDNEGDLYILNADAKSVIILGRDMQAKAHITAFTKDGAESPLLNPTGIYVDAQQRIYICDGGNRRIIRTDRQGVINLEILKPDAEYFPESVEFIPKKMLLDSAGNIYVSAIGISDGIVLFDKDGRFTGFYGSPKVASTAELLADYFWRQFMTDEQKEAMASYVPPEVANFCITDDDFIITVTNSYWNAGGENKTEMDTISMLNPKGVDVLQFDKSTKAGQAISDNARYLNFVAVCADDAGFITFVDNRMGKIYQFDQRMNLLAAFGTSGSYEGAFLSPVAIQTYEDKLYVLDAESGTVTVLRPTVYGDTIHQAITAYSTEKQSEVIKPWQDVLALNANYDLAYIGIGSVLLNQGEYKEAMRYFELGHDSKNYNAAFRQLRLIFLRENLVLFLVIIVVLVVLVKGGRWLWRRRKSRKERA
ncbi:MAG: hypothetical protein IJ518_02890 [Clostridia bacterium]|nr:hypothetical protein [Clostridia bacterium]